MLFLSADCLFIDSADSLSADCRLTVIQLLCRRIASTWIVGQRIVGQPTELLFKKQPKAELLKCVFGIPCKKSNEVLMISVITNLWL